MWCAGVQPSGFDSLRGAPSAPASVFPQAKDPLLQSVERILEDDLSDTYATLPPALQTRFKKRGEEIATAIQQMMGSAHVKAKRVVQLIVAWLRLIPHVNRFFLEQEAKIKADRILQLTEKESDNKQQVP